MGNMLVSDLSLQENKRIYTYDVNNPAAYQKREYILFSTQTKTQNRVNKCGYQWDCTLLMSIIVKYPLTGNPGTREFINDIEERVLNIMTAFYIDPRFKIFDLYLESSTSMDSSDQQFNNFRQNMRFRLILNTEPD